MSGSRYSIGGFEPRFVVSRTDGKPCRPEARYMVLDGGGADPAAYCALEFYALMLSPVEGAERVKKFVEFALSVSQSKADRNPQMSADLLDLLRMWPSQFAQHKDAK